MFVTVEFVSSRVAIETMIPGVSVVAVLSVKEQLVTIMCVL